MCRALVLMESHTERPGKQMQARQAGRQTYMEEACGSAGTLLCIAEDPGFKSRHLQGKLWKGGDQVWNLESSSFKSEWVILGWMEPGSALEASIRLSD